MIKHEPTRGILAWIITMVIVLVLLLIAHFAHAHDHEHPELNSWYQGLKASGILCCDGSEAIHIADIDWESHDGHYRVRVKKNPEISYDPDNYEWLDIPDEAVIKEPNRDGRALLWPKYQDGHMEARCFMPGAMG